MLNSVVENPPVYIYIHCPRKYMDNNEKAQYLSDSFFKRSRNKNININYKYGHYNNKNLKMTKDTMKKYILDPQFPHIFSLH